MTITVREQIPADRPWIDAVRAVAAARRLKPTIPLVGAYGIAVRDEIEMELDLRSVDDGGKESSP
jgi:hypothetical protein